MELFRVSGIPVVVLVLPILFWVAQGHNSGARHPPPPPPPPLTEGRWKADRRGRQNNLVPISPPPHG